MERLRRSSFSKEQLSTAFDGFPSGGAFGKGKVDGGVDIGQVGRLGVVSKDDNLFVRLFVIVVPILGGIKLWKGTQVDDVGFGSIRFHVGEDCLVANLVFFRKG